MRSKWRVLLGVNPRIRLVLTLVAVVLPALALIYISFHHVKSIQRDKKVEALDAHVSQISKASPT